MPAAAAAATPLAPIAEVPDAATVRPDVEPGLEREQEAAIDTAEPAAGRGIFGNRPAWLTTFTWIEIIGAFIILFVGWQLWGTSIAQAHDQNQLKTQFDNGLKTHKPPTPAAGRGALIPASTHFGTPADGSVVAHIQIPAIGVDQYVVSGTTATDLSRGPGLYVGTALPGQAGNVGIAGHRTTHGAPFNRLGDLKPGDKIVLTTTWGEHLTYVVSGIPVAVSPNDVAVLNYFGDNRITLTTCTPEYSSAQRLIAVGKLEDHTTAPLPPAGHVEYHIVDAGTASWNWALLPAVGVELCLLVLLGLSYRRIGTWFGRHAKWFVLVPVWVAGLYLLFDTLTSFLPDTI
jgi:LPXTG-site transpeptidase (sortase) family protein